MVRTGDNAIFWSILRQSDDNWSARTNTAPNSARLSVISLPTPSTSVALTAWTLSLGKPRTHQMSEHLQTILQIATQACSQALFRGRVGQERLETTVNKKIIHNTTLKEQLRLLLGKGLLLPPRADYSRLPRHRNLPTRESLGLIATPAPGEVMCHFMRMIPEYVSMECRNLILAPKL